MDFDKAYELLKRYGDKKLFEHSLNVLYYYDTSGLGEPDQYKNGTVLSVLHDLWEDTDLPHDFTDDEYLLKLMGLITHDKSLDTYEEYIQKIKDNYRQYPEAYYVKLADIKDHLMLKDTLTDRLKEKYIGALRILL